MNVNFVLTAEFNLELNSDGNTIKNIIDRIICIVMFLLLGVLYVTYVPKIEDPKIGPPNNTFNHT